MVSELHLKYNTSFLGQLSGKNPVLIVTLWIHASHELKAKNHTQKEAQVICTTT
jgi:hypothetical protein